MTDKNEEVRELTDEERQRIASCYQKTLEYYGELPYGCKKCDDFDICFTMQNAGLNTNKKGGG